MVNVCVQHFDLYKLPKSKLTNVNILCLVRFGSGRNKLVQLLIRSRNNGGRTVPSLVLGLRLLTINYLINDQLHKH